MATTENSSWSALWVQLQFGLNAPGPNPYYYLSPGPWRMAAFGGGRRTETASTWATVSPYDTSSGHGHLVNVSSEGGSITEMGGGTPGYRVSKLALNGLTRMLAAELAGDGVLVNSVCPGWTDTDMGRGGRPVVEGARSVTWACTLSDDGPSGGFPRRGLVAIMSHCRLGPNTK